MIGAYTKETSDYLEEYLRNECRPSVKVYFSEVGAIYFFVEYTDPLFPLKFSGPGRYSFGDLTDTAKDIVTAVEYAKEKIQRGKGQIEIKKEDICRKVDKAIISGKPLMFF